MAYHCKECNISCPAKYQWEQHINDSKHKSRMHNNNSSIQSSNINPCQYLYQCEYDNNSKRPRDNEQINYYISDDADVSNVSLSINDHRNIIQHSNIVIEKSFVLSSGQNKELQLQLSHHNIFLNILKVFPRTTKLSLKYNDSLNRIELKIPFELKDAMKTYKLFQWDPSCQIWHCSVERVAEVTQMYEYMGGKLVDFSSHPNPLKVILNERRLKGICSTDIQLLVTFDYQQADQFIGTVDVKFLYDTNIINALKQLHPCLLSYMILLNIWKMILMIYFLREM